MQQRLGLAEIIMKQAEIAILDEPTSGLDPQSTIEFLDLIRELRGEGVTVLLSSHQLDQVQRICDRVALFQSGRIVLMGPVGDLARQVLGAGFVVEVEAEGHGLDRRLAAGPGVSAVASAAQNRYRLTADRDVRPEAARAVVAAGGALTRLSVDEPSLDAIYARYFQTGSSAPREVSDAA
jgi:ABC-2 type transport system ATP-binding protein